MSGKGWPAKSRPVRGVAHMFQYWKGSPRVLASMSAAVCPVGGVGVGVPGLVGVVGGGLGYVWVIEKYLTGNEIPLDKAFTLFTSEPNTFFNVLAFPHFSIAAGLIAVIFGLVLLGQRSHNLRYAWAAAAVSLLARLRSRQISQEGLDTGEAESGPDGLAEGHVAGERGICAAQRPPPLQSRVTNILVMGVLGAVALGLLGWYYAKSLGSEAHARTAAQRSAQDKAKGEMALPPLGRVESPPGIAALLGPPPEEPPAESRMPLPPCIETSRIPPR